MRLQIVMLSFIAILSVPRISAQGPNLVHSSGIYFAGSALFSSLDGNFDGRTAFSTGGEFLYAPKMGPGFGAGGILGYRGTNWAYEAGGFYKAHSGAFVGSPFDTSVIGFNVDIEWTPFTHAVLQPYLAAGVGISTIRVKDGSVSGALVGDALYYLGGLRLGLGIQLFQTREMFIRAQGMYRIDRVVGVQGVADGQRMDLVSPIDANGFEISLVIGYMLIY